MGKFPFQILDPDIDNKRKIKNEAQVQVQSVESRHQYLNFFQKRVVNIAIFELGPVSNKSPGNSSYYRGILNFSNPSVFEK